MSLRSIGTPSFDVPDVSNFKFTDVLDMPEAKIYGIYKPYERRNYRRIPDDVAKNTSEGVSILSWQTSGGRIRFNTKASRLAIRITQGYIGIMNNMCLIGSSGMALYVRKGSTEVFKRTFLPQCDPERECVHIIDLAPDENELTFYMPLYNSVDKIEFGFLEGDTISAPVPYVDIKPIVYYGSSITQGGCASHAGNSYQSRILRRNNADYINLGFSGSAKAEDAIVEYMSGLEMSCFVSDYDHNAPTAEHLLSTHEKLYKAIREKQPDIPYIIVGKPDVNINYFDRRDIVYTTYANARKAGDNNVYYIDSYMLFAGPERYDCTVDGCHPNDMGFYRMANAIGPVIDEALKL